MKTITAVFLGLLFVQFATPPGYANTAVTGADDRSPVTINPQSLRQWIISNSDDVVQELTVLHIAKEKVNVDYANFLPSLNLGFLSQGTTTILSTVTFLLPFLLPSNWINIRTDKELFESEKLSYRILQLNSYSAALATYYTILANQGLEKIFQEEEGHLASVAAMVEHDVEVGKANKRDEIVAQAKTLDADINVLRTHEMVANEVDSLKQAMGFPPSVTLILEPSDVPVTDAENETRQAAIDQSNAASPEVKQLQLMVLASDHAKWAQVFAFVQSPSLSSEATKGTDGKYSGPSLTNLSAKGSFNFGFATFPSYRLAETNVDLIQERGEDALNTNAFLVASGLDSLTDAKERVTIATDAEGKYAEAYALDLQRYQNGSFALTGLLIDQNALSAASITRVESMLDLNLERMLLNRALITDSFAAITGCASDEVAKSQTGVGRFLRSVFGGKNGNITLDQLCHVPPPNDPPRAPSDPVDSTDAPAT
jgi:multidrug efflux system outer membrane protein